MQPPSPEELADYTASQLVPLKDMAERGGLDMLAWLLEMAILQAREDSEVPQNKG